VSRPLADIPETLSEAEQQFKTFLANNSYPQTICWITPKDLVATAPHKYSVRKPSSGALKHVEEKFAEGLAKGVGVELRAICASNDETFATIFVPVDGTDAEYHLMSNRLKLSCPAEPTSVSVVKNPLKWLLLSQRDAGRSLVLFG